MNDLLNKYFELKDYGSAIKKIGIFSFVFALIMCVGYDAKSFGEIWYWMSKILIVILTFISIGLIFRALHYHFEWGQEWSEHSDLLTAILDDESNFNLVISILKGLTYFGMLIIGIMLYGWLTGNDGSYYMGEDGEYHFPG